MVKKTNIPEKITDRYLVSNVLGQIQNYFLHPNNFAGLVANISAHLGEIKELDTITRTEAHDIWIKLETINALALANSPTSPTLDDAEEVSALLEKMAELLAPYAE